MIVKELEQISEWSSAGWEEAIDGAEIEGDASKVAALKSLAESCDSAYEAAIRCVAHQYADWLTYAREHLAEAHALEAEGGDSSHADMALEALESYLTDGDETKSVETVKVESEDLVVLESMPALHRPSHRRAENFGRYPHNGSVRYVMPRAEAEEVVESDTDGYDRIVRDATPQDIERYGTTRRPDGW